MRQLSRSLVFRVILFTIGALLLSQPLRSPVVSAQSDSFRAVYDNDEVFNQLSGAARTLLELKFGKKDAKAALGNQSNTNANFPAANKSGGPGGSTQPTTALANNLVNDPAADTTAQDTQSETTIILGSGTNVISSFNDSGSFLGGASKFTGFSRSTNMGTSWIDGGTLPTNPNGDVGDPVLARNNTSRTYLATLQFSGSGIDVFRSDDDALTWMAPTQGAPGKSGMQDKEWIAVDNFSGSGQGNVYLIERDFGAGNGIYFFRSTDNGTTFLPSGGTLIASAAANNVQGASVAVGSDHSVYALYYDQSSPQAIRAKKSTDQGQIASRARPTSRSRMIRTSAALLSTIQTRPPVAAAALRLVHRQRVRSFLWVLQRSLARPPPGQVARSPLRCKTHKHRPSRVRVLLPLKHGAISVS